MDDVIKEVLNAVLQQVFEDWAMMFSDEDLPDHTDLSDAYCAQIVFSGPHNGDLTLHVDNELANVLTLNVLGLDSGVVSDDDKKDAVGELANLVTGHFLTSHFGEEMAFELSAPKVTCESIKKEDLDGFMGFQIEDENLFICVKTS